tara:strand:- start:466 stop:1707 length:1242 start_codon:yes stop_codon:yes gene_type:complete
MADRKITALDELSTPAADDVFAIIDSSVGSEAAKNKKIQYTTLLRNFPAGNASSPSIGWTDDSGVTGLYRSAANTISVSVNQNFIGSFQSSGFQLGAGTPAAQLHLFSTDTTDQVIIENSDTGSDTAPDVVLFRSSASPADNDNLGYLIFRGKDSAANDCEYAAVRGRINDATDGSEDGFLDFLTQSSGTLGLSMRIAGLNIGMGETDPLHPLHIRTEIAGTALFVSSVANTAASSADITMFAKRGTTGAGQDNDILSTITFQGKNDATSPEAVQYAAIQSVILDASNGTEDGQINFRTSEQGVLTTQFSIDTNITISDAVNIVTNTTTGTKICTATTQKLAFWNATPVDQPAAVTDLTVTASSGTLPTPNGSVTIANAASATTTELLEYCVELESKLESALARLREVGLIAT